MHKKLEAELVSLAHSILQMKNKEDVQTLHIKAQSIYEKLTLLKFVESYINTPSDVSQTKEEIIETLENELVAEAPEKAKLNIEVEEIISEKQNEEMEASVDFVEEIIVEEETIVMEEITEEEPVEEFLDEKESIIEKPADENEIFTHEQVEAIFDTDEGMIEEDKHDLPAIQFTLEEEFKDAISSDVATQLFQRATKESPEIEAKKETKSRSLNDSLFTTNVQVGLNDRIAFVKYLFEGSQEDFNRVLSQLNSFKTEDEAKNFIKKFVKPDYDWNAVAEYEERLMQLIARKFS